MTDPITDTDPNARPENDTIVVQLDHGHDDLGYLLLSLADAIARGGWGHSDDYQNVRRLAASLTGVDLEAFEADKTPATVDTTAVTADQHGELVRQLAEMQAKLAELAAAAAPAAPAVLFDGGLPPAEKS